MGAEMNEKPEKKVRRQYDREFKADAVRLVTEGGHRLADVAREVGITPKMLSQWRAQLEKHTLPEQAFIGQGHDREAEVKRLKRQITILEMERDILKKAIGIFAEPKR
jgi:transposase